MCYDPTTISTDGSDPDAAKDLQPCLLPIHPVHPAANRILAHLPASASQRFCSQLERVSLPQGQVIYEADAQIRDVYFPETAVFSMLSTMADGQTVEVGPVAAEGLVGLRVFLGAETSSSQVIVHVPGEALRIRAQALREELRSAESVMGRLLLRYTQMLLAMTGQSAACYKLHPIERQVARWLLLMHDLARKDELWLTHELIGLTLGVRRSSVTEVIVQLRGAGLIDSKRGRIVMRDRGGLERRGCECYEVIKGEYERLDADYVELTRLGPSETCGRAGTASPETPFR